MVKLSTIDLLLFAFFYFGIMIVTITLNLHAIGLFSLISVCASMLYTDYLFNKQYEDKIESEVKNENKRKRNT